MAVYRYQVVSVGMWRGKIKRWNTTLHLSNTTSTVTIRNMFQATGYKAPGDVDGACSGGVASIAIYNASGGQPISNTIYFDWQVPTTWIAYTGTVWASVPAGTTLDAAGESALVITGRMPGLSSTGKPVFTRKYLHAVPSRSAADFGDPDVDAATVAAVKAQWPSSFMASPAGVIPNTVDVETYYGNHQRVRGRRKTVKQVAASAFSLGVLAGGGATTSGQGEPFPGGEF